MSKRGEIGIVPDPMSVSQKIIQQCQVSVDGKVKKIVRKILNLVIRYFRKLPVMGEGAQVGLAVCVPAGSKLGSYSYIGKGFYSPSPVVLGDLCMVSTNVTIVGNDHGIDDPLCSTRLNFKWKHAVTVFGADSWVGNGVIIRSGVSVGWGAVIAAGAVVVKDVPPCAVVGGNPARIIKYKFSGEEVLKYKATLFDDFSRGGE